MLTSLVRHLRTTANTVFGVRSEPDVIVKVVRRVVTGLNDLEATWLTAGVFKVIIALCRLVSLNDAVSS
jgi:hypothetical protein